MALSVRRLQLSQFRCYEAERLSFSGNSVVLTGENGAGKTNILEAVSLLTPGRGLRGAGLDDVRRIQAPRPEGWAVSADIDHPQEGSLQIGTGIPVIRPDEAPRRQVRVNGQPAAALDLGRYLAAVWLVPSMDRLFIEGASERRRFLDRLVLALDAGHASRVAAYDRALRERARLLDPARAVFPDPAWLAALERQMAENGVAIAAARRFAVEKLQATVMAGDIHRFFARPRLAAIGGLEEALGQGVVALELEERFARDLSLSRDTPRPPVGPHRSDLGVWHDQSGAEACRGSTGEQKALLISIVLSHARLVSGLRGFVPLLLLDEVAAHLDVRRRQALFSYLEDLGGQFFLTGTESALFEGLSSAVDRLEVGGGRIVQRAA